MATITTNDLKNGMADWNKEALTRARVSDELLKGIIEDDNRR